MVRNGSSEWVADGEEKTADLSEGGAHMEIESGRAVKVTGWTYNNEGNYHLGKAAVVKEVQWFNAETTTFEPITPDEDGNYLSDSFISGTLAAIQLFAVTLEPGQIKVADGQVGLADGAEPVPTAGSVSSLGGVSSAKDYVNREGGYTFTLAPAEGTELEKVYYKIGEESRKEAVKGESGGKVTWTIPEEDVIKGILAGGISISVPKPPVGITAAEAEDSDKTPLTKTTIMADDVLVDAETGKMSVNGYNDVTFTVDYAEGLTDYDVKLGQPTVSYTPGGADAAPVSASAKELTYDAETGIYTISKEFILKAMDAGTDITIAAQAARDDSIKEFTFTLNSEDIVYLTYEEYESKAAYDSNFDESDYKTDYDSEGNPRDGVIKPIKTHTIYSSSSNPMTATAKFKPGNYVVLSRIGFEDGCENIDFVKVEAGSRELSEKLYYDKNTDSTKYDYELGVPAVNAVYSITTARLPLSSIKYTGNLEDTEEIKAHVIPSIYSQNISDDYVSSRFYKGDVGIGVNITDIVFSDPEKNYRVKTPITYKISSTGDKVYTAKTTISGSPSAYIYKEDIKKAAFDKATVTVNLELVESGIRKYDLYLDYTNGPGGKFKSVVKVSGMSLGDPSDYSNDNYQYGPWRYAQISYGKSASVELAPSTGYDIEEIYLVPDDVFMAKCTELNTSAYPPHEYRSEKLKNWRKVNAALPDGNADKVVTGFELTDGKATIDISLMDRSYRVIAVAVDGYNLVIRDNYNDEIIENGSTIDVQYCEEKTFAVAKGYYYATVDSSKVTYAATIPDTSEGAAEGAVIDVAEKVLNYGNGATAFGFSGSDESVRGKTVTLKVTSRDTKDDTDDEPVFAYTIYINVSAPVTTETVDFSDAVKAKDHIDMVLGVPVTIGLKAGEGFTRDCYEVKSTTKYLTVTKSEDGKSLTLYYGPEAGLYFGEIGLSLVEKGGPDYVISGPIKINLNHNTDIQNADISGIKASPGANTVSLDFSGVNGEASKGKFDPDIPGLYWLVNAVKVGEGEPEFKDSIKDVIPVKTQQYDIALTDDREAAASEPVKYNISVHLVQGSINNDGEFSQAMENKTVTPFTAEAATRDDATYATKISFVKSKAMPKKIYSTMDTIEIGTVKFADITKGKKPTEQRLKMVEIRDKAGNVLASTKADMSVISMDDNVISFSPKAFGSDRTGKYDIIAYAVEPKGKEVTCKQSVSIVQGISDLSIVIPSTVIYKQAGKELSIKTVTYFTPANAANKKVNYSLYTYVNNVPQPLSNPGITIKKGVVKIDKNTEIPGEGLKVAVRADAADYEGNKCSTYSDTITIRPSGMEEAPVYMSINGTQLVEGESYYSSEFGTAGQSVYVYDANMTGLRNYTVKATGLTTVKEGTDTHYRALKPIIKKASITVTPTDSTALKPLKVNFKIKSDTNMSTVLKNSAGKSILVKGEGDDYTAVNSYAAGKYMTLTIKGEHDALIDHSVKFTGIKKISSDNGRGQATVYQLNPTAKTGKIVITDKADGNKKITIKLTNDMVASVKTATKVTASNKYDASYNSKKKEVVQKDNKGKIFNALYYADAGTYAVAGSFNKVTYSVKTGSKAAEGTVLISTSSDIIAAVLEANGAVKAGAGVYTMALTEGKFTIDYSGYDSEGSKDRNGDGVDDLFYIPAGKYSFTVTPIDDQGKASGKTASVTVKAAAAPKAKVAVAATTINKFESEAPIGFKTMNNIVFNGNDTSACYTGNRLGINTAGVINKFATVFSTNLIQGMLVCIKSPEDCDAAYAKKPAAGMSGWIEYGWTNLDGSKGSAYVKITVKPDKNGKIVKKPSA